MWWPNDLKTWTEVASNLVDLLSTVVTLGAGVIAVLWAYTKFVLERGLLPGVQFSIDLETNGLQHDRKLLEILLHLKNVGSSTLIVTNLRFDTLYIDSDDELSLFESGDGFRGKIFFPKSLRRDIRDGNISLQTNLPTSTSKTVEKKHKKGKETRGIAVLDRDTFVLPGVDQVYTFATAVPKTAIYVLIWSSFEYAISPNPLQERILYLSRRLGLIQFSLTHIGEPHTYERVFKIQ